MSLFLTWVCHLPLPRVLSPSCPIFLIFYFFFSHSALNPKRHLQRPLPWLPLPYITITALYTCYIFNCLFYNLPYNVILLIYEGVLIVQQKDGMLNIVEWMWLSLGLGNAGRKRKYDGASRPSQMSLSARLRLKSGFWCAGTWGAGSMRGEISPACVSWLVLLHSLSPQGLSLCFAPWLNRFAVKQARMSFL